ncbi:MAG: cell wall-binding repeat-containing protein, partial [Mycolicibacterium sp.]|nr:cell wall-binding repeat-containing protein [Mycolicibacterium sp.]
MIRPLGDIARIDGGRRARHRALSARWARRGATIAAAGVIALSLLPNGAGATSTVTTSRLQGSDRYATAAAIAEAKFVSGTANAIVASGVNFPDALAGAYLAGIQSGAILLTDPNAPSAGLVSGLSALHTTTVTILGGPGAVTPGVQTQLASTASTSSAGGNLSVSRIQGATRYDTMQMIDTTPPASAVGTVNGKPTAIIANGLNFPDALAASAASYKAHLPIILTDPNTLSSQAQATLTALGIQQILIMGGTNAVATTVESAINGMGITTLRRFAGTDRTDTAQQFATFEVS